MRLDVQGLEQSGIISPGCRQVALFGRIGGNIKTDG